MSPKEGTHSLHTIGQWMHPSQKAHKQWLNEIISSIPSTPSTSSSNLHPVITEFKTLIESNTRIYQLIEGMFTEVPYKYSPTGLAEIKNYHHFLAVLNHLLTTAPSWTDKAHRVGLVGLPINALLDWPMGTPSGYAAFLDPEINAMIKKVLNVWGEFLKSSDSAAVLDDGRTGWFGETGLRDLTIAARVGPTTCAAQAGKELEFGDMFVCEPGAKYHGFKSWDDFFTRVWREGMRPVAEPTNDGVIVNACESRPYRIARGAKASARDKFWIKAQPYSIFDMLGHDAFAEQFVGGTVYQAFLSALSYHRWHAPVSGKIVKAYVIDGAYYSEPLFEGVGNPEPAVADDDGSKDHIDLEGQVISQAYITSTATRALIFIEADEPKIGLMAFIGVGMAEVSTCDITVQEGQYVKKGDQIGMFHFGGSTHCLLFRKGVDVKGFPEPGMEENMPVCSQLATVN